MTISNKAVAVAATEDTVFVSGFSIPDSAALPGSDGDGASIALLIAAERDLTTRAKALTDKVKEDLLPHREKIRAFGETAGKHKDQTDDAYAEAKFTVRLADGTTVTAPKSVVFGKTALAMVDYLVTGGLALAKFESFVLSNVILKKSEASTNGGGRKGETMAATEDDGDTCIVSVQSAGTDKDGNLKGWFEVLALAAKAILIEKDEVRALKLIDGMDKRTGLGKGTVQAIVQMIVNATVASGMRKTAKKLATKAEEKRKANFAARDASERLDAIKKAARNGIAEVQPTKGLGQAH